jgi:hypothetical protein
LLQKEKSFKQDDLLFACDGRRYAVLLGDERRLLQTFVFGGRKLCKMEGDWRFIQATKEEAGEAAPKVIVCSAQWRR